MTAAITVENVSKRYSSGHQALHSVDLEIARGEIFALLGPNGAGKTTLISIICGIVTPTTGRVIADGHDVVREPKAARRKIGLVPQELSTDAFETVLATVRFSRGLFGRSPDPALIERVLRDLSLWEKRNSKIMELSGGMKRRVLIAKALAHEPTAGVDVELRRDMWRLVSTLKARGVTIILTTHYIEEAEEMADRVGVIDKGRLIVVEDKHALMAKLGRKTLTVNLAEPLAAVPESLVEWAPRLEDEGKSLVYEFDGHAEHTGIPALLARLAELGIAYRDLNTRQSSLEDIFVNLVHAPREQTA